MRQHSIFDPLTVNFAQSRPLPLFILVIWRRSFPWRCWSHESNNIETIANNVTFTHGADVEECNQKLSKARIRSQSRAIDRDALFSSVSWASVRIQQTLTQLFHQKVHSTCCICGDDLMLFSFGQILEKLVILNICNQLVRLKLLTNLCDQRWFTATHFDGCECSSVHALFCFSIFINIRHLSNRRF
jgi:hypothetical protein